jgi:hypothetical protein
MSALPFLCPKIECFLFVENNLIVGRSLGGEVRTGEVCNGFGLYAFRERR